MKVHSLQTAQVKIKLTVLILLLHVKLLWQQFSNDDVIYDLKGLNQNGSYSLRLKYSTITLLGHSRVSVQCRSDPTPLMMQCVFGGELCKVAEPKTKIPRKEQLGKALHRSWNYCKVDQVLCESMRGILNWSDGILMRSAWVSLESRSIVMLLFFFC